MSFLLQCIEISVLCGVSGGIRFGPRKGTLDIALPKPALTVRDELAEFDQPNPGLHFFNNGSSTSELLTQGNLATGPDSLELRRHAVFGS